MICLPLFAQIEVILENESGQTVGLFWYNGKDAIPIGLIEHSHQTTITTLQGHRFYFKPKGSDTILQESIIEEDTARITLYPPGNLSDIHKEREKWFKKYYQETGRQWKNYWPRDPVTYYYHKAEQGQIIHVSTDRTKFHICKDGELTAADIEQLDKIESDWNNDLESKLPPKCAEKPGNENCKAVPPSFQIENDLFFIGRMNKTTYCRPKIIGVANVTFEIINICAHGPHAFRIFNFLSDDEMEHIKVLGQFNGLSTSMVMVDGKETTSKYRTSQTTWIERDESFIVDNIIHRIADVVKVPRSKLYVNASAQPLQLVHYFGGEFYKQHWDYGTDAPHTRYITFLMYLNDVTKGGNTSFPRADAKCKDENGYFGVQPIKGSVMFFYNMFPDGNVDSKTLHYAEPPVNAEKWMTNLWIWDVKNLRADAVNL